MLLEGALVSVALALIGCFLVVRGLSLLGDAISHSVLPGIVLGFLISAATGHASLHSPWILIGATLFGLAAAFLVQNIHTTSRVKEDAALGITFTTLFALGVVMINLFAGQADLDPGCVLYGNLEHFIVNRTGFWPMAAILGGILLALVLFYRQLLVATFDPLLALSLGINVTLIHYGLMTVLSLTIVTSFEAVGAILAVALLVLPGATARLWTDRMTPMLLFAAAHGLVSTLLGYWLSHQYGPLRPWGSSAGGAITVAGFTLFVASWLASPRYGLIVRWWMRAKLKRTVELENLIKTIQESGGQITLPVLVREQQMSPALLHRIASRGQSRNWLTRDAAGALALTKEGQQAAHRLRRAHELWEAYLQQELSLPPDHVHEAAEWIEHHLDQEQLQGLEQTVTPTPSPRP
jgi:ABC-type Mn2+/Zn2+ transport system permease subunit/Mn-dependent DtxR family transcriptional regulator